MSNALLQKMTHKNRRSLAKLFHGQGIELGVASGQFSEIILRVSNCERLWSIDRWSDHHDLAEYKKAAEQLALAGSGKCVPLRMTFEEALPFFADESLDFIYIDGYAHTGQDNGKTLEQWWPKIKQGGIFAGHDYHPKWPKTQNAVDTFTFRHSLDLFLTSDSNEPKADEFPSWWIIKTESRVLQPTWHSGCPVEVDQSIVLVGNGPSVLLDGEKGPIIDSFDHVLRFNTYAIKGFEKYTGTKTTLWSTFGRGSKPRDEGEIPSSAVYVHGDKPKRFEIPVNDAWGISRQFFDQTLAELKTHSTRTTEAKKPLLPSSGLVVIAWLLSHRVKIVHLVGFDHFSKERTGMHHYWIPRNFQKPPEHDGEAEKLMIDRWISEGRVKCL